MPSRLSAQWLCGNSCTWAHNVRLHIAGTNEPKSAQQVKQGAYYTHLTSVRFEHSVCRGLLMTTYDHESNVYLSKKINEVDIQHNNVRQLLCLKKY